MERESKFKKPLYTGAVAIGLALGTMGVASAATQPAAPAAEDSAVDVEVQDPSYQGSIVAPDDADTLTEAEEASQLESLATVAADDAAAAANAAVPGVVGTIELDNENGTVVYSVAIVDASGSEVDVKVDAGDGTVLDQQTGEEIGDDEATGVDDDGVQHESEHDGDNDPDEGHED